MSTSISVYVLLAALAILVLFTESAFNLSRTARSRWVVDDADTREELERRLRRGPNGGGDAARLRAGGVPAALKVSTRSRLFDWGQKTTVHNVKSGKTETSAGRRKGYMVYKRADGGFVVPSLDSSVFDTKHDANRFIDSWTKNH
jgi:hypothetical protein